MRKLFTIVTILILAISCSTNQHMNTASSIGLANLENYAAKTTANLPYDFNYMVITNQSDFDATFGIATSGNINITYPSFNGQTVVACIAQPSTNLVTIHFEKAEVIGKEMNVYCTTSKSSEQLNNATVPVAIATVPKVLNVTKVVFYTNGEKITSRHVEFKNSNTNETDVANENKNLQNEKPVVLKRMMRRPAVI
jgi:hypothetical protein